MSPESQPLLFTYGVAEWLSEPNAAFDAFLSGYRFNQRRLRASSFAIYKGMFGRLQAWAQQQGLNLLDLREPALEEFLAQRSLAAETRHRYLLLFRTLFEHLAQLQAGASHRPPLVTENPARTLLLERQAPARTDPDYLNREEVDRFVKALSPGSNWKRVRDRALAVLLLGAGLRSSEALALRTSDLQFHDGQIQGLWVQAQKPHPARQVPLQRWAHGELMTWLQLREQYASGAAPPTVRGKPQLLLGNLLFPSNLAGAALNALTLFRLVKTTLDAAGLVKRYEGPTLLRNSCGALWLQQHEPLQVSLWMGHAQVRTTELLLPRPSVSGGLNTRINGG